MFYLQAFLSKEVNSKDNKDKLLITVVKLRLVIM
ncbi:MAG: hypothetical protein ACI8SZ_000187 [Colwellia sp.]|jgi:hypothetical protein